MTHFKGKKLVLFSNTFPYGKGETFLADELPFVSSEFERVIIIPLFKAQSTICNSSNSEILNRTLPHNVEIERPLLDFEDKNKRALIDVGFFDLFPFTWTRASGFSSKEFWNRMLRGKNIALLPGQKKAPLKRRVWIYFNYLFIKRAITGNKKRWREIVSLCSLSDVIYFYWGDKSVLIGPDLKKELSKLNSTPPAICARLHGSDLYEGAKGYLPYREEIYGSLDFAAVDSEHGCSYIRENYHNQPKELRPCFMGSIKIESDDNRVIKTNDREDRVLHLLSCANVIELKRVKLIFRSILEILENTDLYSRLISSGYDKISWRHFGSGELMDDLRETVNEYLTKTNDSKLIVSLMGQVTHNEVLEYYNKNGGDLFFLLSRSEGVPISLMEALSYSIPIVATSVGGVPEIFTDDKPTIGKMNIGYLLSQNPTIQEVVETILNYASLSQEEKMQMRKQAFDRWKEKWNGATNYQEFAYLLSNIL